MKTIKYDGMPEPEKEKENDLNQDELLGFILRKTTEMDLRLTYEEVQSVIDAETEFLRNKGFIDN